MTSDEDQQHDRDDGRLKVFPCSYRLAKYDVMCGRNKVAEGHGGNKRFRALIEKHCLHYMKEETTREERRSIVTHILEQVVAKGGYFLKQEYEGGEFMEISIKYAREKIVHSLRDTSMKFQSIMEGDSNETPSMKTKQAGSRQKSSMNAPVPDGRDAASLSSTESEDSQEDSTTRQGDDTQEGSDGEETFKSYQSNASTLEEIDECRIRRKRHLIDCKPRKKPKLPQSHVAFPVRGKHSGTKNHKKQLSSPVHRKQGIELLDATKPQRPPTTKDELRNRNVVRGMDALAAHRALVLAAIKAEHGTRLSSHLKIKPPHGRIVTPQKGTFIFTSQLPSSKNVDSKADDSSPASDAPESTCNNIIKAPSALFGTCIVKGLDDNLIKQSPGRYHSSTHSKDKKARLIANPVPLSQGKDRTRMASVVTSCRSDTCHQGQSHAPLLEETEDERISCWGEYC